MRRFESIERDKRPLKEREKRGSRFDSRERDARRVDRERRNEI